MPMNSHSSMTVSFVERVVVMKADRNIHRCHGEYRSRQGRPHGEPTSNDISIDFSKNKSDQQILDVFGDDVLSQDVVGDSLDGDGNSSGSRLKSLQKQILSEMSAIDPERALTSMQSWAKFVQLSASRKRSQPFASLEEYIPYRVIDAGELYLH